MGFANPPSLLQPHALAFPCTEPQTLMDHLQFVSGPHGFISEHPNQLLNLQLPDRYAVDRFNRSSTPLSLDFYFRIEYFVQVCERPLDPERPLRRHTRCQSEAYRRLIFDVGADQKLRSFITDIPVSLLWSLAEIAQSPQKRCQSWHRKLQQNFAGLGQFLRPARQTSWCGD